MNIKTRIETSKLSKTQRQVVEYLMDIIETNKIKGDYVSPRGSYIDDMPRGTRQSTVDRLVELDILVEVPCYDGNLYDIKDGLYVTGEITL